MASAPGANGYQRRRMWRRDAYLHRIQATIHYYYYYYFHGFRAHLADDSSARIDWRRPSSTNCLYMLW